MHGVRILQHICNKLHDMHKLLDIYKYVCVLSPTLLIIRRPSQPRQEGPWTEELSCSTVHQHSMSSNIVAPRCQCVHQHAEAVSDVGSRASQTSTVLEDLVLACFFVVTCYIHMHIRYADSAHE